MLPQTDFLRCVQQMSTDGGEGERGGGGSLALSTPSRPNRTAWPAQGNQHTLTTSLAAS